jgi:thymidine phosphorylase
MTVTHGNVNPADRKLYQLRSITGTVESLPLIISSIASKQICFPVHRFLLDVRFGDDSFLKNADEGSYVGAAIDKLLGNIGTSSSFTLTPALQPTGSAIGNALEVAEALAVMGVDNGKWDQRGIVEQRLLVINFFAKMMASEFAYRTATQWTDIAAVHFESGAVKAGFEALLLAHGVPVHTISNLLSEPHQTLGLVTQPEAVRSSCSGTVRGIDQVRLGEIIYHELGAGGNQFSGEFNSRVGVKLEVRLGDAISKGSILCWVFNAERMGKDVNLESCFRVS